MNLCRKHGLALRHPLRQCGLHTDGHGLLREWINQPYSLIYYTSESSTQVDKLSMQLNLLHKLSVYTIGSSTQVYLLLKWIFYTSGSSTQVDQLIMQLDLVLMRMSCKKVKK